MTFKHPDTRNTINLEDARVLSQQAYGGGQYVLRLHAPETAREAKAGSFVHMRCDPALPMRRPMSIMRTDPRAGWIDILYRAHGEGTRRLAARGEGETISILGPIGVPFRQENYRRRPLLIGGGVGIPPMIFLAEHMKNRHRDCRPLLLAGSETPFPFTPVPSRIMTPGIPEGVIAAAPLLEDWGIPSRLSSLRGYAGCYDGFVTDLAREWLLKAGSEAGEVEIYSCGPTPMLKAVAGIARDFGLPCQVSLEEYMACAVGGCAGCTVEVQTPAGAAMKRVCVDGPVFEAASVFPDG